MADKTEPKASRVLVVVSGGIAAYKAVEVLRGLQKRGCEVRVVATESALEFVGAPTWEGLAHVPVASTFSGWPLSSIPHIALSGWADAVVVVPATANIMAKMVAGIADDLASATLLATPRQTPVLVAPAMNVHMWQAPATQNNVRTLRERGARLIMPVSGHLACDDVGTGKLAEVDVVVERVMEALVREGERPLKGRRVLITAGPTHEAIDPVRYIANASSGKMGYALAEEAARAGADVTLVSGPVSLETPEDVTRVDVTSARQMHVAASEAFAQADIAICAAAVADYTPKSPADHKLKKARERLDVIELVETVDILASLCARKGEGGRNRTVVGFAAETNDLAVNARAKLERKGCDLVVANDVSRSDSGFGSDTNHVVLVSAEGDLELPTMSKREVARRILERAAALHDAGR